MRLLDNWKNDSVEVKLYHLVEDGEVYFIVKYHVLGREWQLVEPDVEFGDPYSAETYFNTLISRLSEAVVSAAA